MKFERIKQRKIIGAEKLDTKKFLARKTLVSIAKKEKDLK